MFTSNSVFDNTIFLRYDKIMKLRALNSCSFAQCHGFFRYIWVIFLFTACASVPRRSPVPEAVTPAVFSSSGEVVLDARWWLSLHDAHLNALMDQALVNNPGLLATYERLAQAKAVAKKDGAGQFPTLDVRAGADRTTRRNAGVTTSTNNWSVGASAGYEVDLWGRVRSTAQAARLDMRASEADLKAAGMTLSASVANAWYRLVEQQAQVDLLTEQLAINEQIQELINLRFKRGLVRAADVLRQRQFAEATRGQMALARSRKSVLAHQLAILLGQPPLFGVADSTANLINLSPLPQVGVPADLIQRRPDIQAAFFDVMAADKRVASAVADRFPRLSLSGQATSSDSRVGGLFKDWLFNFSANLVGPLIDGGRRRAEVARTKAIVNERLQVYGQVVLNSLAEVEDALVQEAEQAVYLESLEKQLILSEQVIVRARDNYTSGGADYLRVLDALQTHQQLERTHLTAKRELIGYRVDLCRALGGGWEMVGQERVMK